MKFFAHTAEDDQGNRLPEEKWQPLSEHLRNVARLAKKFATPLNLGSEAEQAGLLHDLGKYRTEFQEYLRNKRKAGSETHHAIYGAAHAFTNELLPQAFAIAGHHAGLPDQHDLRNSIGSDKYQAIERVKGLVKLLQNEIGERTWDVSALLREAMQREDVHCIEFASRMIFSALVDADRLDTAHWPQKVAADDELTPQKSDGLLGKVLAERERKRQSKPTGEKDAELRRLRNDVFDACLKAAALAPGFFSLTVPTGGGKTLSAMDETGCTSITTKITPCLPAFLRPVILMAGSRMCGGSTATPNTWKRKPGLRCGAFLGRFLLKADMKPAGREFPWGRWLLVLFAITYGVVMLALDGRSMTGWYSPTPYHRYQAMALLHGHLYLADSIEALQPGLAWHDGHVEQVWGLGIGLWLVPFEAMWRLCGGTAFPERIALGCAFALLALYTASTGLRMVREGRHSLGLALVWLVLLCPPLWTLARASQLVFEETVLYAVIVSLAILVSIVRVAMFQSRTDYLVCCALSAFAGWVRPTHAMYGLCAVVVCAWIVWLRRHSWRAAAMGAIIWGLSAGLLAYTNYVRFGSATEFGHRLTIAPHNMVYLTRFGNPFRQASVPQAAEELFGLLFLAEPRGENAFADGLFPGEADILQNLYREGLGNAVRANQRGLGEPEDQRAVATHGGFGGTPSI